MQQPPLVFISEPIHVAGMDMLAAKVSVVVAPDTSRTTALQLVNEADAAILRATTRFDREVISMAPKLKVIARTGIGIDNVDIKAAGEAGIYVCNAPNGNEKSVAEHTLAMVLCLAKQVFFMDNAVRKQNWSARYSPGQMEIAGKTIGLVGFGSIGKEVAKLCIAVGLNIIAYRPSGNIHFERIVEAKDMAEIFVKSDFVSLHCPSSTENYHLVNKDLIESMKPTAYLINTSRGDLIDEMALSQALAEGKIAGAALDVFEKEPLASSSPLLSVRNLILSPHVAGATKESDERLAVIAAQAVLDALSGKVPSNVVNKQFLTLLPGQ